MTRLIHISDNHFGPQIRYGLLEPFRAFVRSSSPDAVIISGDHTSFAKAEEFAAARLYYDSLGVPWYTTPGNHDLPFSWRKRVTDPYREYRRVFGHELNTVHTVNDISIICLNSTKPHLLVNGMITHRQLRWFKETIAAIPAHHKIILVTHHHFIPPPGWTHRKLVFNRDASMLAFLEAGIDMILVGHEHRNFIGTSKEYYPDYLNEIIVLQSGSSLSNRGHARERLRNTFNEITIDGPVITVQHYEWDELEERFRAQSEHRYTHYGHRTQNISH